MAAGVVLLLAAEAALLAGSSGQAFAAGTTAAGSASTVSDASDTSGPAQAQDEASAVLMARLQDRQIEVLSARAADSTTWALPSGELQTEVFAGPVRVKQGGVWKDIDTSLSDTGAALQPSAAAADVSVSDGGDTTLASVATGDKTFGLGWPGLDQVP